MHPLWGNNLLLCFPKALSSRDTPLELIGGDVTQSFNLQDMTGDDFPVVWAQIAFWTLSASSIGDEMHYSDTMYCSVLIIGGVANAETVGQMKS